MEEAVFSFHSTKTAETIDFMRKTQIYIGQYCWIMIFGLYLYIYKP